jgi:predicted RecA/RadA family phage recombinase
MLISSSLALTSLRQIDPDQAQLSRMVLALLDGRKNKAALQLTARRADRVNPDWVACGSGVLLHIAVAGGRAQMFRQDRLAEMVAALDAAEPLLAEIEARTGIVLDPAEAVAALPENSLVFEIAGADHQDVIHFALSPEFVPPPGLYAGFEALEIDWEEVPVAFETQIAGPSLSIEATAAIVAGDLILIGGMVAAARVIWSAEIVQTQKIAGRYDMLSGQFTANGTGESMVSGGANGTGGAVGFSVPISIRLPNRMASAADLAGLRPGTALNIGALTQGLPVSVLVGDQEIARGELVQVGDQFAVMIEQKIVHADPPTGLSEPVSGAE